MLLSIPHYTRSSSSVWRSEESGQKVIGRNERGQLDKERGRKRGEGEGRWRGEVYHSKSYLNCNMNLLTKRERRRR